MMSRLVVFVLVLGLGVVALDTGARAVPRSSTWSVEVLRKGGHSDITTGGMEMIGVAITGGPRHLFPFVHSVAANFAFGTENAAWMCASDNYPADISLCNVPVLFRKD